MAHQGSHLGVLSGVLPEPNKIHINNYIILFILHRSYIHRRTHWRKDVRGTSLLHLQSAFLQSPFLTNLNMRISSAAIFFTFFAATGQLSGLSTLGKITIIFFNDLYATDTCPLSFHVLVAGADSVFSRAPTCDSDRFYTVKSGDTCNSIATANGAPTLVSFYIIFPHYTYSSMH